MNDKELVWLPKDLAERLKSLEPDEIEKLVLGYIDETRLDYKQGLEALEDDVLTYKAIGVKIKNDFRDVKNEHLKTVYDIWEDIDKDIPAVRNKVDRIISELKPLKDEINQINKVVSQIRTFDIKKLIEFIDFFISNVYGETENILKYLMDTYKTPKKEEK